MSSYMHRYSGRYIRTVKKIHRVDTSDPHTLIRGVLRLQILAKKMRLDRNRKLYFINI